MSTTVALSGELTIHTAAQQYPLLQAALAQHLSPDTAPGELCLQLGEIEDCDSAGVQLLLALKRALEIHGCGLQLQTPSRAVKDVLDTYALDLLTLQHLTAEATP